MVIEDQKIIESKMNGKIYNASNFAITLRKKIFQEHFGMSINEVEDPLNNEFLKNIDINARV